MDKEGLHVLQNNFLFCIPVLTGGKFNLKSLHSEFSSDFTWEKELELWNQTDTHSPPILGCVIIPVNSPTSGEWFSLWSGYHRNVTVF